jgi:hypothetical protein
MDGWREGGRDKQQVTEGFLDNHSAITKRLKVGEREREREMFY